MGTHVNNEVSITFISNGKSEFVPRDKFPLYLSFRDGPLEKLRRVGEGLEFSSRRNFFSLSNFLYEFILGHSMNIFKINWPAIIFFI